MLNIPKIYNDPVLSRKRQGNEIDPYVRMKESLTVDKYHVELSELPSEYDRVKVTGKGIEMHELIHTESELTEDTYWVDYVNGIVYFHETIKGRTLTFEYLGTGVHLFPDSRVYLTADADFSNLRDKLTDVDRAILVERNRITEQLLKHPQPSEVIDTRIDYNGKVFKVAKDRIDSEQRKIEEAYVDARGKRFDSLKLRIDSLQLATEDDIEDIDGNIEDIWASIDLIPGMIHLEVGKLQEFVDGEVARLQSQINMTPEQIQLKVEELREYADGRIDHSFSQIEMLADKMELKVDVNGVVSSINLSEEGIRLQGRLIHLDGDTRIDNATIKSAHIDSLSASKIRAGILRSENDNTMWNLNTGAWSMKNANLDFGNGALINFNDPGNKIQYAQLDPQTGDTNRVGIGLGRNINERFPFIYMGSTHNMSLQATDRSNFTGFISNTDARMNVDNAANSVVGSRFHIRDRAVSYRAGFSFDLSESVNVMFGMNANYTYDLGKSTRRFRNVYANYIRHNGEVHVRDSRSGRTSGWLMQTAYSGDGSGITLRGLNGGKYNYIIGARSSNSQRITSIFLKNKPNVSSDMRLKEDIDGLELGLDFALSLNPVEFKFKKTHENDEDIKLEYGFLAQEVEKSLVDHKVDTDKYSLVSQDGDGYYAMEHEQLIAPIIKSIQELYHLTRKENAELRQELSELREQVEQTGGKN